MSLSRRDLLRALAGLGATACTGRPAGRTIAGSIVGGNHALGHLLRSGARSAVVRREEVPVLILGAGIAGLSAAWGLERAGFHDYLLLELEDVPGGTARSGVGPVSPYPWAAHYVPVPPPGNRPLVALLEEVGAVAGRDASGRPVYAENVLCREPQERVFFRGEWYEGLFPRIAAGPEELSQLEALEADMRRWAATRDAHGRRAFALPRSTGADTPELRALDRISMADYLKAKGWTAPRLRWFVEYGCRDDFGTNLGQTSAWAGIHYYASRLEEEGSPPAEFLTWPEGNGHLVAHLARRLGSRLRTRALVTDVDPQKDRVDVVYLDAARGEAVAVRAEHAVSALPHFLGAAVIAPWRQSPPPHLREALYAPWMVANLTLRDRPTSRGFPLAWDNVLYGSPSLGYVVATHQSLRDDGPTVLTYYYPFVADDPRPERERMLATPWEERVQGILADLTPGHRNLRDLVDRVDVYLWGHAMIRPRTGFCWSEGLAAASQPLGRLLFAHTDLSGMALFEEAQHWGLRAAESILRQRKLAFRSWLE